MENKGENRSEEVHIYLRNSQKKAHYIRVQREILHD